MFWNRNNYFRRIFLVRFYSRPGLGVHWTYRVYYSECSARKRDLCWNVTYEVLTQEYSFQTTIVGAFPLQTEVCEYKYPFDISIHQSQTLFNIQTGKAASNEVKTCLLDWWGTSQELRSWVSGQSHTLRRAYQGSEVVDIQAGRYQQSTICKQEYSGTQNNVHEIWWVDFWFLPPGDISTLVMSSRSLWLQCHSHCVTVMERWPRQRRLRPNRKRPSHKYVSKIIIFVVPTRRLSYAFVTDWCAQ